MKVKIRSCKRAAKQTLKRKYSKAIWALIGVNILSMLGSNLVVSLFTGDNLLEKILTQVVSFVVSLILCVFSAGLSYMYLNMARGKTYAYKDILYFFNHHPDRVIIASFALAIINEIAFIPYYCAEHFMKSDMITTMDEYLSYMMIVAVMTVVAMVINLVLTIPLTQVYFLQADELELGGIEALKKSAKLMKGYKIKYLLLELSFFPQMFLAAICMAIGVLGMAYEIMILSVLNFAGAILLFRLMPQMKMAEVFFYRALIEDHDNDAHREHALTKEEEIMSWSEWRNDSAKEEKSSEENDDTNV